MKARIVVQDVYRGTWEDTFAAAPTSVGQRLLMFYAQRRGWSIVVGDVSTAFLHAPLPEGAEIFACPPPSLKVEGIIWRLRKAVYGLRQAPRLFQEHLAKVLSRQGRTRLLADPQMFLHAESGAIPSVHADDLLLAAPSRLSQKLQDDISRELIIKWGETFSQTKWVRYLGREWRRTPQGVAVRMAPEYYNKLLKLYQMEQCKPVQTPAAAGGYTQQMRDTPLSSSEVTRYRSAVGKVKWLIQERPDVAYTGKELARHMQQPSVADEKGLKHLLRYLQGTRNYVMLRTRSRWTAGSDDRCQLAWRWPRQVHQRWSSSVVRMDLTDVVPHTKCGRSLEL